VTTYDGVKYGLQAYAIHVNIACTMTCVVPVVSMQEAIGGTITACCLPAKSLRGSRAVGVSIQWAHRRQRTYHRTHTPLSFQIAQSPTTPHHPPPNPQGQAIIRLHACLFLLDNGRLTPPTCEQERHSTGRGNAATLSFPPSSRPDPDHQLPLPPTR
jgi:hypothetical protein